MAHIPQALMGIEIAGHGAGLPDMSISNQELIDKYSLDSTPEWIERRTGIEQRYVVDSDKNANFNLSIAAGRMALARAGLLPPYDIDSVLLATTTPDRQVPANSAAISHGLGVDGTAAMDVNAACSGFVYAINDAYRRIHCGEQCSLVIGTDVLSRIIDWQDRGTSILLGDGSGAVVLRRTERQEAGLLGWHEEVNGSKEDLLYAEREGKLKMEGRSVYKEAVELIPKVGGIALERAGLTSLELKLLVLHQANRRIIESAANKMDVPMDKMIWTGNRHANTSSASIPLALNEALESGRINRGDAIMLVGFGAGMTAAASVIRY